MIAILLILATFLLTVYAFYRKKVVLAISTILYAMAAIAFLGIIAMYSFN